MIAKLPNIHPGEILDEEFLKPLQIPMQRLANETRIPIAQIEDIVQGKGRLTPNIALRLSKFWGTSAEFWLGLQLDYDLEEEKQNIETELETIHSFRELIPA